MSAALAVLEQRAEDLREGLERDRRSLVTHERGSLRSAREALREEEHVAQQKRDGVAAKETELSEINAAIHALRGTRPIADIPQA